MDLQRDGTSLLDLTADKLISELGLSDHAAELIDDGEYALLAKFYADLSSKHPDCKDLKLKEIAALQSYHAWDSADDKARLASEKEPENLQFALAFAENAYLSKDWQVAIERLYNIRERFDPQLHEGSARTLIDELYCRDQMADAAGARMLAEQNWPQIRSHRAATYGPRNEIFEILPFIAKKDFFDYAAWSMEMMIAPNHKPYVERLGAWRWNRRWTARFASDVTIVALGQNCLPWILPNRWGLRPKELTLCPFGPFDYLGMVRDTAAEAIEEDYTSILAPNLLSTVTSSKKLPVLAHKGIGTTFYHEQGPWWARGDWEPLKREYRKRISRIRAARTKGKSLYVFCLCGVGDPVRMVAAFERSLARPGSRLLILNVLKQPVQLNTASDRITVANIPYPEDYGWNTPADFDSPRGHAFEREIVETIRKELINLRDWRTLIHHCRAKINETLSRSY